MVVYSWYCEDLLFCPAFILSVFLFCSGCFLGCTTAIDYGLIADSTHLWWLVALWLFKLQSPDLLSPDRLLSIREFTVLLAVTTIDVNGAQRFCTAIWSHHCHCLRHCLSPYPRKDYPWFIDSPDWSVFVFVTKDYLDFCTGTYLCICFEIWISVDISLTSTPWLFSKDL